MKNGQQIIICLVSVLIGIAACGCFPEEELAAPTQADDPAATFAVQTVEAQPTSGIISFPSDVPSVTSSIKQTIVQPSATQSIASPTPAASATATQPPCDLAAFVMDITIPDGAQFYPGDHFTKTWRIKNIGSCSWTSAYSIVFVAGDRLESPASLTLPGNVAPHQEVDLSVDMVAPRELGKYRGDWKLRNAAGRVFSFSDNSAFYVDIEVIAPQSPFLVYDFAEVYCAANWSSLASSPDTLLCPGTTEDDSGYVVRWDDPRLEDGSYPELAALEVHPTWQENPKWDLDQKGGWTRGIFSPVAIQTGSHFKARLGCLFEALTCDVNFSLFYSIEGNPWIELGNWHEAYDGTLQDVDISLIDLVGKNVDFLLQVDANSNGGSDRALWVNPRVEK